MKDINIVLVMEIVSVSQKDHKDVKLGKGWTVLRIFSSDDVVDLNSGKDAKSQR